MANKPLQSLTIQGLSGTYFNTPLSTAPIFNTTQNYAVDDCVFYNAKLYKFTSAHSAGNWNPDHVSEITISNELKNLKNESVTDVQIDGTSVVSGSVANIPVATVNDYGVLREASGTDIKAGTATKVITAKSQFKSAFYGLAEAAGDTTQSSSSNAVGTYTDEAKAAIKSMLGVNDVVTDVTVSGTTPAITAVANTRYICGEVATLDFTPSSTGICDVIFESGSTATVLTLPNTVKMPEWFDATTLEPDTIYEISIVDGVYGAVMSWPV